MSVRMKATLNRLSCYLHAMFNLQSKCYTKVRVQNEYI